MARISLRAYLQDIEGFIESHQVDQAIAHCQYILRYYSKHIDTYRLLGKSFLESRRYGDAADIFQRVLSSVPDDFVSHVGMSIIREDEGNLDEAIWHMERAFDVQPANNAIQRELSRLYGKRDGLEPPKIRLTRGALARMYYKGELYPQTISEIRAVLASTPQRFDLLVLLAQAHFRAGQRFEAAEICSTILKALPFCLEANHILGEILAVSERSAEAKIFQQRAQALNPYLAHMSPDTPTADKVPDSAIVIEKLIWSPDKAPEQPAWASSLGVDLEDANSKKEELPAWLTDTEAETGDVRQEKDAMSRTQKTEQDLHEEAQPESAAEGELPEWMQAAGWEPGGAASDEIESQQLEDVSDIVDETLAPADMPNWLQEIAPDEVLEEPDYLVEDTITSDSDSPEPKSTGSLPWIDESPSPDSDSIATWLQEKKVPVTGDLLSDQADEPIDLPEWLQGMAEVSDQEEILQALSTASEDITPQTESQPEAFQKSSVEGSITSDLSASDTEKSVDLDGDEALAWLEGLAEQQGPLSSKSSTSDEEDIPDWLASAEDFQPDELSTLIQEEPDQEIEPTEDLPEWLSQAEEEGDLEMASESKPDMEPTSESPLSPEEEEAFAWLEGLAEKQGAGEAIFSQPEDRPDEAPQWVRESVSEDELKPEDLDEEPRGQLVEEVLSQTSDGEQITEDTLDDEWLVGNTVETTESEKFLESSLEEDIPIEEEIPARDALAWLDETETAQPETVEQLSDDTIPPLPEWLKSEYVEPSLEPSQAEEPPESLESSPDEITAEPNGEYIAAVADIAEEGTPERDIMGFDMLFGPGELQGTVEEEKGEEPQQLFIEETPIIEGDTAPTGIRSEEDSSTSIESTDLPSEEEIPDWLEGLEQEVGIVNQADDAEELHVQPEIVESMDEAAAFAWLEGLAAKQGTAEASLLQPEEKTEEPPAWVTQASEGEIEPTQIQLQAEEEHADEEITLEELDDQFVDQIDTLEDSLESDSAEVPSIEVEGISTKEPDEAEIGELETGETIETADAIPELPGWLTGLDQDSEDIGESTWQPTEGIPGEEMFPEEEELAAEKTIVNVNEAGLVDFEQLPGIGFIKAQAILEYRDEHGEFKDIEELQNVPGLGPSILDSIRDLISVGIPEEPDTLEPLSESQIILMKARNAFVSGEIPETVDLYAQLIESEKLLPEVINDLNEALYRFPVEVSLWEALGDACFRADKLQNALDAYTKAEELLR
ncbi:MAG: helix-hairpin-helix domain-containing protein [Anaerolineales bacterium]|nr:MAG: helix-hairpin-helix domain-containing protein [Anaerolineales bacterium]